MIGRGCIEKKDILDEDYDPNIRMKRLSTWTERYDFTNQFNLPCVYRMIYTLNQISIGEDAKVCECFFEYKNYHGEESPSLNVSDKQVGKIKGDIITWGNQERYGNRDLDIRDFFKAKKTRLLHFFVNAYTYSPENYLMVHYDQSGCPYRAVQMKKDNEMTHEEVYDYFSH